MENLQFEFAKPRPFLSSAMYAGYPMPYGQAPGGPFPYRPAGMNRPPPGPEQGGRGMGMGYMGPPDMGPPNAGRGRGILGKNCTVVLCLLISLQKS